MNDSRLDILSMPVDPVSMTEAVRRCEDYLQDGRTHIVITPNPEMIVRLIREQFQMETYGVTPLSEAGRKSSLSLPDGYGLILADRILGSKFNNVHLQHVVHGVDVLLELCALAAQTSKRVVLVGGGDGVALAAAAELRHRFPGLLVFAVQNSFDGTEQYDSELCEELLELRADIVFVAYGMQKQEAFMVRNMDRLPGVSILMGVGGAFDFLTGSRSLEAGLQFGKTRRAPHWVRQLHMEWFFRLLLAPWRVRRIWDAVVVFLYWVVKYRVLMHPVYRPNAVAVLFRRSGRGDVELLTCARADNHDHWQMVQGGMDGAETPEQAAVRELGEEIGLTDHALFRVIKVLDDEYQYDWHFIARWKWGKRRHLGQRQRFVLVEYFGKEFEGISWKGDHILEDGFHDCRWVPMEKFLEQLDLLRRPSGEIVLRGLRELLKKEF